jgi:hypothetical protein
LLCRLLPLNLKSKGKETAINTQRNIRGGKITYCGIRRSGKKGPGALGTLKMNGSRIME